ncbi:hypothetical protein [Chryseobacterium fistulae]|nr:hypothetical protein [Chryseobacterium fistulae]
MMKKKFIATLAIASSSFVFGQVGINTNTPQSTLEVTSSSSPTSPEGMLVPRFTVAELAAKDAAYGAAQNGILVFISTGVGSTGKTSDIKNSGFYYYDNPTSKWKVAGNSSSSTFNVTTEKTASYTALATDDYIKLNINTAGQTLTLPTTGVTVGKIIMASNIGNMPVTILPQPRNASMPISKQLAKENSGSFIYLGNGLWDWASGF